MQIGCREVVVPTVSKSEMKDKKKFIKNIISVMIANIISLLGSITSGFLLPKIFNIEEYGYYKIFTLYMSYAGLLHFGFLDGMLLKISGMKYEELDKQKYRKITMFYAVFQLFVCLFVLLISFSMERQYHYIFFFLGLCIFSTNLITYFQFISQATMRFNEFSIVKVVTSVLTFFSICILYGIYLVYGSVIKSKYYIMIFTCINWIILLYYLYKYRGIVFGKIKCNSFIINDIKIFFTRGFILTISYQILQMLLNLDRQFVALAFSISEYAVYSFAYSLISMITTVISAISLVLFPTLKRVNKEVAIKYFAKSLSSIEVLVLACLGGYYPLAKVIDIFLPEYKESIEYLIILFPGLVVSSCITIVVFTYYKLFEYNVRFFIISCSTLGISFLLNLCAWKLYKSPSAISFASVISMLIWFIATIVNLRYEVQIKWRENFIYVVVVGCIFYIISYNIKNLIVGFFTYEVSFLFLSFLFYHSEIKKCVSVLKKMRI